MITIDGSIGEGGGQIIRSSLALSLLTGEPVEFTNIRANRIKPGLKRQHLTAVRAAAEVGDATVSGDELNSSWVEFRPSRIRPGEYRFDIGTAGSTMLVLQTVLPALMVADTHSTITLAGGTHNPMAPCFEFIQKAYVPLVEKLGPSIKVELVQAGFYPAGGGKVVVSIQPTIAGNRATAFNTFELLERGKLLRRHVRAIVSNLPEHIGERECKTIVDQTGWKKAKTTVDNISGRGPGNALIVASEFANLTEVFCGLGKKNKSAEQVARDTYKDIKRYEASKAPVGEYLADQIMLPIAVGAANGSPGGTFRTLALSDHSTTHIDVLQKFLEIDVSITENGADDRTVEIK